MIYSEDSEPSQRKHRVSTWRSGTPDAAVPAEPSGDVDRSGRDRGDEEGGGGHGSPWEKGLEAWGQAEREWLLSTREAAQVTWC